MMSNPPTAAATPSDPAELFARAIRDALDERERLKTRVDWLERDVAQMRAQLVGVQRVLGALLGDAAVEVREIRRCLAHAPARRQEPAEPGHAA